LGLAIAATRRAQTAANCRGRAKPRAASKLKGTIYTAADEIRAAGGRRSGALRHPGWKPVWQRSRRTVAEFGGIDICVNNASAISLTNSQMTE